MKLHPTLYRHTCLSYVGILVISTVPIQNGRQFVRRSQVSQIQSHIHMYHSNTFLQRDFLWYIRILQKLTSCILCHGTFKINHGWSWFISNVPWQRMPLISFSLPTKSNYKMLVTAFLYSRAYSFDLWYLVLLCCIELT